MEFHSCSPLTCNKAVVLCGIKGQCVFPCRRSLRKWMHRMNVSVGWTSTPLRSWPIPAWALRAETSTSANWESSTSAGAKWELIHQLLIWPFFLLLVSLIILLSFSSSLLTIIVLNTTFTFQVTHELLDKVGEVEANLQSHAQFQDRMDRLTDWVVVTHQTIMTRGLNPVQAQVDPLCS